MEYFENDPIESSQELENHDEVGNYLMSKELLGKGQYASVYKGYTKSKPRVKIAVKKIEIKNKQDKKFQQNLEREVIILRKLNHKNIIKLYDVYQVKDEYLYIFMELCDGGDLKEELTKKKQMQEKEVMLYLKQITDAFKVIHRNKVIHRDLKPANILLSKGECKICDFGFARELQVGMNEPQKLTRYGSPLYMSPQILSGDPFSSKCDVWSLGIISYQLLHGRAPWIGTNPQDLLQNIRSKPLIFTEKNISDDLKNLIIEMLQLQEETRLSWEDLFNHPLLNDPDLEQKLKADLKMPSQKNSLNSDNSKQILLEKTQNESGSKSLFQKICCCFF